MNKSPLYEQVADLLEQEIMGACPEGSRLPSEQTLSERFQVSRTIVREALKLLKERGLIDSRTGSGAFITRPEAHNVSDVMGRIIRLNGIDIPSIYEVRSILEVAAVRKAAVTATTADLAEMEALLARLKDRAIAVPVRRDSDFEFHYRIAVASGNELLAMLVEVMSNIFKEIIKSGIFVQGGIDDAIVRHEKIMRALRSRDPDAAETAMHEHLDQSLENALQYQKKIALAGSPARNKDEQGGNHP